MAPTVPGWRAYCMLRETTRPDHNSTCVTSRGVGDARQGEERVFVIGERTSVG